MKPSIPLRVGVSPGQIVASQRARLIDAIAQVISETGIHSTSVTRVSHRAGLSRASFYRHFPSIEECLDHALDRVTLQLGTAVADAYGDAVWPQGAVAGLTAILDYFEAKPWMAHLCLVTSLPKRSATLHRHREALKTLRLPIDLPSTAYPSATHPYPWTAEATSASIAGILRSAIIHETVPPFIKLLPPLVDTVLRPYFEPALVRRAIAEATTTAIRSSTAQRTTTNEPSCEVPARLLLPRAHRARACMLYLAFHPGASNQEVARGIGISHHGQISTILNGLARSELLTKQSRGAGRPNVLHLTPHGVAVASALRAFLPMQSGDASRGDCRARQRTPQAAVP